jgi:SNF2 family DNA or RNA helicase
MIEIDPTRFRTRPFAHQVVGTRALVENPYFALFDEMRLGKSKQLIDAACILSEQDDLGLVLVVAPAGVRQVWLDVERDIGEIRKHAWVPSKVMEYHARGLRTVWCNPAARLRWWVTNYEFIRAEDHDAGGRWRPGVRLRPLMAAVQKFKQEQGSRVLLVLDESAFIKSPPHRAQQSRACHALGVLADRRVIFNGTPVTRSPLDLWSQMRFLSHRILPFRNWTAFKDRYACLIREYEHETITGYQNLDELSALVAPYCLQRKLADCFDLPADLPPIYCEVPLSEKAWGIYKTVRDEMLAWLDTVQPTVVATTAAVRMLRLAQICGGFLGGLDSMTDAEPAVLTGGDHVRASVEVDHQKQDRVLEIIDELKMVNRSVVVWCRFRSERERLAAACERRALEVYEIYGSQPLPDRARSVERFARARAADGFAVLLAQPAAGGFGLDLSAISDVLHYSRDFNALTFWQSSARVRHGLKSVPIGSTYLLATGPRGQQTVDHVIDRALRQREEVARWTAARWRHEIVGEE